MIRTIVSKELDALEAELALALASPSLPAQKREEIEQRLNAIRAKAVQLGGGVIAATPAAEASRAAGNALAAPMPLPPAVSHPIRMS